MTAGDATYGSAANIVALEEAGVRAYVPLRRWGRHTRFFGQDEFVYDPERDGYRCPQGQPLRRRSAAYQRELWVYRAPAAACRACPLRSRCTDGRLGRTVVRSFSADYLDRVRANHATAAYQKAVRKRAVWVEPLFGEAKPWHGLRRFRRRRLPKVNTEALLTAAGPVAGGHGPDRGQPTAPSPARPVPPARLDARRSTGPGPRSST